jgi:hypothetical protein
MTGKSSFPGSGSIEFVLGSVDIWGHVILSDRRERRISPFGVNSTINPEILRRYSRFASLAPQNDMFLEMSTEPNDLRTLFNFSA